MSLGVGSLSVIPLSKTLTSNSITAAQNNTEQYNTVFT